MRAATGGKSHLFALGILILFVFLAFCSAAAVPLFEASDEAAHFLYAHGLASTGKLPAIPTRDDLDAAAARGDLVAQWSIEAHQPPLYYALGALLISPTTRADLPDYLRSNDLIFTWGRREGNPNQWLHSPAPPSGDTHVAVWTLRLFSLALACGTLWCIYRAAYLATFSPPFALTVMLTTACIPTFAAISASVNNDNLVTLLCSAAVYWTLRVLRFGLRKYDWALIALIVAAIALTKFTGLAVVAVVLLGLFLAVRDQKITRNDALLVLGAMLAATALNAGWWYARNWQLYGDPLALQATQALWGRTFAVASESGGLVSEIPRIWQSFWLMIGYLHLPVWGPVWFYAAVLALCVISVAGWVLRGLRIEKNIEPQRHREHRETQRAFWILALAAILPAAALVYGTRTVDISYGRLLFPGLVGIVPLLVMGWRRLFGRFAVICALPLIAMTALMPYTVIRPAYPLLESVDALPVSAIPLNIGVEGSDLTILGYEPLPRTIENGDAPPLTIYLSGSDPRNPALTVSWLSAVKSQNIGQITVYPGMSPTDVLEDGVIYKAIVPTAPLFSPSVCPPDVEITMCDYNPGLIRLELKWQTDGLTTLQARNSNLQPVPILFDGPIYSVFDRSIEMSLASFGDVVSLTHSSDPIFRNGEVTVRTSWGLEKIPPPDLTLTVQILYAGGRYVTNADGDISGYPTRVWIPQSFGYDERVIELPDGLPPGTYLVAVGWYTRGDLVRLPATARMVYDNLAVIGTFEVEP